jgi:ubiquitin-conjugating enzyme E2 A
MSSASNPTTTTATTAQRRLMRDLRDLTQNPVEGINAAPISADNIFQWNAILDGPDDSLFEDASFVLTLKFPQDYPNHPPDVKFVTRVFHPNICKVSSSAWIPIDLSDLDMDGSICLDILQQRWSASLDVSTLLVSIRSLLTDPNPASPANSEAAMLYQNHRRDYERRVREYIDQQIMEDEDNDDGEGGKSGTDKKTSASTSTTTSPSASD